MTSTLIFETSFIPRHYCNREGTSAIALRTLPCLLLFITFPGEHSLLRSRSGWSHATLPGVPTRKSRRTRRRRSRSRSRSRILYPFSRKEREILWRITVLFLFSLSSPKSSSVGGPTRPHIPPHQSQPARLFSW